MRRSTLLAMLALFATRPLPAQPADEASRSAARDLGYEGVDRFQKGDYPGAYDKLRRAYSVLRAPTLGLWEARALEKLGKLVEASERYHEVARLTLDANAPDVQRTAQADAKKEREALLARIPKLVVSAPDGASVTIDDQPLPAGLLGVARPVNPGKHRLVATRGAEHGEADVEVRESETREVALTLGGDAAVAAPVAAAPGVEVPASAATAPVSAAPAATDPGVSTEPGSSQRTIAWVTLGVGAAGLALGSVFGAIAISKKSDLETQCPDQACPPSFHGDDDSYDRARLFSTVGFVVGGVGAAAGLTLLLTAPSPNAAAPRAAAVVGPGFVGLRGAF